MKIYVITVRYVSGEVFGQSVFDKQVIEAHVDRHTADRRAREMQESDTETQDDVEDDLCTAVFGYAGPKYLVREVELIQ